MAIKKSEIYSELWKSCDELRGGMDASQYKDYILAILFVKYLSDKHSGKKDSPITIPKGGSFSDMVALKGNSKIGGEINKILRKLAEENGLKGIIDVADFDDSDKLGSGKTKVDRLSNIIAIFQRDSLDFSKNRADGDDLLGDAYEYLMRHFATESGKSKGQFYTPSEVSQIIAKVIGAKNAERPDWTVYDPTAGSGSLLLKVAHETPKGITIYGQENDVATTAMAQMNMWIHNYVDAEIVQENTISEPQFKNKDNSLKTFDFVVSNPPFSSKAWSNGIDENNDKYKRFDGYGIPPKTNGDYAFLLHMIKSLNNKGKGAIILPHGVLFRGNVEAKIRKNIIERKYIKGIIGLPPNLFYGTTIPASIIIFDKENAESRKGVFIIDASKGFVKDGNKNRLQSKDIQKIIDTFEKQLEIPKFSRMIQLSEISNKKNDYNLNISKYIDSQEEEDIQNIERHLKGGIPSKDIDDLDKYWKVYPSIRKILFSQNKRDGYENLDIEKSKISSTISEHSEFQKFSNNVNKTFNQWKTDNISLLDEIKIGTDPKTLIIKISEDILNKYSKFSLIDNYDVYQHLMNYWEEVMQDDCYLISQNGWNVSIFHPKTKSGNEKGWDSELIPKNIVISKYFDQDQNSIDDFQNNLEKIEQQKETLEEENSTGDEDVFSEARSNTDKITKGEITKRLKIIKNVSEFSDEFNILTQYLKLIEEQVKLKSKIKNNEKDLDKNLLAKYLSLKESEIKEMIIQDKWLTSIENLVNKELEKTSDNLTGRIKELAKRYDDPLSQLTEDTNFLTNKVVKHLEIMGFKWKK
jgi:type I restriction enzyme M protein